MSRINSKPNPLAHGSSIIEVQPLFHGVQAVEVPQEWESFLSPALWGVIDNSKSFTIRQHVKVLPKQCCTCPPCVKQENTYSVLAGITKDAEAEFLRLDEVSDDWNRCCCSPYHPLKIEGRQYIPVPGDGSKNSDYTWLKDDFKNDLSRFTNKADKAKLITNMYKESPVLFTMQRDDGERCCCKCPCKWLSTFVCCKCCEDGMHIYAGPLPNVDGIEIGRPVPHNMKLMGSVHQPQYAGCCTPTLHLRADGQQDNDEPFGKVEGPCFFGGWLEMCCDFEFFTSRYNSAKKSGDIATITKKKPASLAGAGIELFTDADVYTIVFKEDVVLSPAQKTTVLTAQVLADYMYFDGNTEKCSTDDDGNIYCYCCYCSIIGAICPCYIVIPTKVDS